MWVLINAQMSSLRCLWRHHHSTGETIQRRRCWSIGRRSYVPAGVTFTYPQHPVPVEGDIDMPSNKLSQDVSSISWRRIQQINQLHVEAVPVWWCEVAETSTEKAGRWCNKVTFLQLQFRLCLLHVNVFVFFVCYNHLLFIDWFLLRIELSLF